MFEIIVSMKNDWIDLQGVPDVELFEALSDWSSGKNEVITINGFHFNANEIIDIRVSR